MMPSAQVTRQTLWATITQRVRDFLNTVTTLATAPRTFLISYFAWAGTRFSDAPKTEQHGVFPYMKPFKFIGYAILLSALVLPLTQFVVLDLARQNAHRFEPDFVELLELMRDFNPAEQAALIGAIYIDFDALTGVPVLDTIISDSVQYAAYVLFSVLMWSLAPRALTVKAIAHSFAYLFAFVTAV